MYSHNSTLPPAYRRDARTHERRPLHIVAARIGDDPKTVLSTYPQLRPQSDQFTAERVAFALSVID